MENSVQIMGILNVTPDSFSDGGQYFAVDSAVERAFEMLDQGANIIDVGGESSGPGSENVNLEEEMDRVLPVIEAILRENENVVISVDTYKSELARRAIELGAKMINDVTACRGDREMAEIIAASDVKIVIMYSKDLDARTTIQEREYENVILEIKNFFEERIDYLKSKGVSSSQIVLDPGMGHFVSSLPKYSFEIVDCLTELKELGYPILLGPSKKSFLGGKIDERSKASIEIAIRAARNGASILRMHDVLEMKEALRNL